MIGCRFVIHQQPPRSVGLRNRVIRKYGCARLGDAVDQPVDVIIRQMAPEVFRALDETASRSDKEIRKATTSPAARIAE